MAVARDEEPIEAADVLEHPARVREDGDHALGQGGEALRPQIVDIAGTDAPEAGHLAPADREQAGQGPDTAGLLSEPVRARTVVLLEAPQGRVW